VLVCLEGTIVVGIIAAVAIVHGGFVKGRFSIRGVDLEAGQGKSPGHRSEDTPEAGHHARVKHERPLKSAKRADRP
jgi:hypothetical protein